MMLIKLCYYLKYLDRIGRNYDPKQEYYTEWGIKHFQGGVDEAQFLSFQLNDGKMIIEGKRVNEWALVDENGRFAVSILYNDNTKDWFGENNILEKLLGR